MADRGLTLHFLDGYRSIECQQGLWDFFMAKAKATLPNPTPEACRAFVVKYVSDPTFFKPENSKTWPVHVCGGAIDVTLKRFSGELLYMGGVFDDSDDVSSTDYFEARALRAPLGMSDEDALRNRRLLYWAMAEEGFTNYAYEWWHYDFGDSFWALTSGREAAFFGPVAPSATIPSSETI